MIPYGRQGISESDVAAVVEVLRSEFLTQGPLTPRFEKAVASHVGVDHAVATNSATSALHIACLSLGLGSGDLLWTVPNTFVASANCGLYCGAEVDFVDIDPYTWNMSVSCLKEKLAAAKKVGRVPKVLVPVHFAGQPTDQETIWDLAREYGFRVLEDASHSIGALRNGERVGSCRWSDVSVFSFHPVKIVTTGEGGIAVTNSAELAQRMAMLRSHGITREPSVLRGGAGSAAGCPIPGGSAAGWYYEQQMLGYNYRMSDIHAALGLSQLSRLEEFVKRRNQLAGRYNGELLELPLLLPTVSPANLSSFHLYVIRLNSSACRKCHRDVFEALRERGIGVNLHYTPVHLQPYFRSLGFTLGQFPESEAHGREAITLPLFPDLQEHEQDSVIRSLREVL